MPPVDQVTANRGYKLPYVDNDLEYDVSRIRDALNAIDSDIQTALAAAASNLTIFEDAQLTGAPTATTASAGTNSTRIATTAFVHTVAQQKADAEEANAVATIRGGVSASFDTLQKIAAAIGGDATYSATVAAALAGKAALSHQHNASDINAGTLNIARLLLANQAEAEAGTLDDRLMTPLRVMQALNANSVPVGSLTAYLGPTPPAKWLFLHGQSLSRTTYSKLFNLIGTHFGAVDGNSFSLPDLRGRVVAGLDNMGGGSADRLTGWSGVNGDVRGSAGGLEYHPLSEAEMPHHAHVINLHDPGHSHGLNLMTAGQLGSSRGLYNGTFDGQPTVHGYGNGLPTTHVGTGMWASANGTGGNAPHNNVQPTIVLPIIVFAGQ